MSLFLRVPVVLEDPEALELPVVLEILAVPAVLEVLEAPAAMTDCHLEAIGLGEQKRNQKKREV